MDPQHIKLVKKFEFKHANGENVNPNAMISIRLGNINHIYINIGKLKDIFDPDTEKIYNKLPDQLPLFFHMNEFLGTFDELKNDLFAHQIPYVPEVSQIKPTESLSLGGGRHNTKKRQQKRRRRRTKNK
jgi:hypothetical protein